jgi:hypothetical protein
MRIIFVPQYPSRMRYQEWWYSQFPYEFRQRGFSVYVLGEKYMNQTRAFKSDEGLFSPIDEAIKFECEQIKEYMDLNLSYDDILFWADESFPGLFGNVLFHKRPKKMYAFCHATSLNKGDYYEDDRRYKYPIERSTMTMFDKVFVGSYYHAKKIHDVPNLKVTYLPYQPRGEKLELFVPKQHMFMSASRPGTQKVNLELENQIEDRYRTRIHRPVSNSWDEYFANLRASRFLLITAQEDTFGYQIVDAVTNNCIPIAPYRCSYPELLPKKYLYKVDERYSQTCTEYGAFELTLMGFTELPEDEKPEVPRLLCHDQMKAFYDVICNEMKGE